MYPNVKGGREIDSQRRSYCARLYIPSSLNRFIIVETCEAWFSMSCLVIVDYRMLQTPHIPFVARITPYSLLNASTSSSPPSVPNPAPLAISSNSFKSKNRKTTSGNGLRNVVAYTFLLSSKLYEPPSWPVLHLVRNALLRPNVRSQWYHP